MMLPQHLRGMLQLKGHRLESNGEMNYLSNTDRGYDHRNLDNPPPLSPNFFTENSNSFSGILAGQHNKNNFKPPQSNYSKSASITPN